MCLSAILRWRYRIGSKTKLPHTHSGNGNLWQLSRKWRPLFSRRIYAHSGRYTLISSPLSLCQAVKQTRIGFYALANLQTQCSLKEIWKSQPNHIEFGLEYKSATIKKKHNSCGFYLFGKIKEWIPELFSPLSIQDCACRASCKIPVLNMWGWVSSSSTVSELVSRGTELRSLEKRENGKLKRKFTSKRQLWDHITCLELLLSLNYKWLSSTITGATNNSPLLKSLSR